MQTANLADEKYKRLAELFPNVVTETIDENGEVVRCIDRDVLMQEIILTLHTTQEVTHLPIQTILRNLLRIMQRFLATMMKKGECPDGSVIKNGTWQCSKATFEEEKAKGNIDFVKNKNGGYTVVHKIRIPEEGRVNAEDGGNKRFIMVELPEETAEDSEARKAGYKNICEIGKERIRRAGKKIKSDSPLTTASAVASVSDNVMATQDLDTGFRVLKLDSSNMQEVYYTPQEFVAKDLFELTVDNIKPDRTAEDLLFQVMQELDVPLSAKIERTEVDGHEVWNVEGNYLMACFDAKLTKETITAIAKLKPYYFVMRDASMADDSVAVNFDQIFKSYSPETTLKVL